MCEEIRDIHLHARRGLNLSSPSQHDVLWFSRSSLEFNRRMAYDECLLEWLLSKHVKVISPETMTLAEQVREVEGSRVIGGVLGSAFYTLLMAVDPPPYVCLCPRKISCLYPAQAELLGVDATFAYALELMSIASAGDTCRRHRFRLLIPRTLKALSTLLPGLSDDPKIASLVDPERLGNVKGNDIDEVARVLADPLSDDARLSLGRAFEAQGVYRCAFEQYAIVADLGGASKPEALRAAGQLAQTGKGSEASPMVRHILVVDPGFRDAMGDVPRSN